MVGRARGLAYRLQGPGPLSRPASPTVNRRLAKGVSFQHPLDEDNKKAAFQRVGGLSSLALKFGTPIPISAAFALTREEYSIWRRVSKKKAPALIQRRGRV